MTKTNITQWEAVFDKQALAVLEDSYRITDDSANELLKRVKERTPEGRPELWNYPAPRGYVPGTLRASWELQKDNKDRWTLYNNQPYAERVEYGWSTQAPNGMLRLSLLEWNSILTRNSRKYRK